MKKIVFAITLSLLLAGRAQAQSFSEVQIVSSPDVHSWAETAHITRIVFEPNNFRVEFDKHDSWPNVIPPGWDGPIQYTLWPVISVNGQWFTTGAIEFWKERGGVDGPYSNGAKDWWGKMPPMDAVQPKAGDKVGFMVVAGDQRLKDVRSVEERSAIVWLTVPANDSGVFNFTPGTTPPLPPPVPVPTSPDLTALTNRVEGLALRLVTAEQAIEQLRGFVGQLHSLTELTDLLNQRIIALEARPVLARCSAAIFGIPVACKLNP